MINLLSIACIVVAIATKFFFDGINAEKEKKVEIAMACFKKAALGNALAGALLAVVHFLQ